MKITADQLDRATGCGAATASTWVEHINGALARFEINTPERVAMFLAQVGHESQSLKRLVENLNYSAEGLLKTWPTRYTPVCPPARAHRQPRLRKPDGQWVAGYGRWVSIPGPRPDHDYGPRQLRRSRTCPGAATGGATRTAGATDLGSHRRGMVVEVEGFKRPG